MQLGAGDPGLATPAWVEGVASDHFPLVSSVRIKLRRHRREQRGVKTTVEKWVTPTEETELKLADWVLSKAKEKADVEQEAGEKAYQSQTPQEVGGKVWRKSWMKGRINSLRKWLK